MLDKFTTLARQAITQAENEAANLGHSFIGTEHILLGLTGTTDGIAAAVLAEHGVTPDRARREITHLPRPAEPPKPRGKPAARAHGTAATLAAIGIDIEEIRRRADDTFGPGQFLFPRLPLTPRTMKAIALSWEAAQAMGNDYIDTQHLLLGLLAEGEAHFSYAIETLNAIGANPAQLRPAILARAGKNP